MNPYDSYEIKETYSYYIRQIELSTLLLMKRILLLSLLFTATLFPQEAAANNYSEKALQDTIMRMLVRFTPYIISNYQPIDTTYGCFKSENTMGSNEQGVRPNADLSMIAAFIYKYGIDTHLPQDVSRERLRTIAYRSLRYAFATHKAIKATPCIDGKYWGSTSKSDCQWESSLWAMSVAYSAYFQWQRLTDEDKQNLYRLLSAECNYELERDIPTGYEGDTKAEENGWEVDVLAATLGLFPDDPLAPRWFERMRAFAINSYSHPSDANNNTIIDPWYDQKTISDLYIGANLYPDWTLQNHDFFHTSYQNVVIQELGEAALALRLFQTGGEEKWKSNALLHNCDSVAKNVLNWLTLPDGEQAMPNGNDWSLFLYDQVTSYSTMACMKGDADALLFERQALQQIRHRQATTDDGSWLLRPDVGARRMGVQAHRVMMTWLMHELFSTKTLTPSTWEDFASRHSEAKLFPCQQIVRTLTPDYFACFSFSKGKRSYTGYIAPFHEDNNNLVVPYRERNTGNITGYYEVTDKNVNSRLDGAPDIRLHGKYFEITATLLENDSTLRRTFTLRSTPEGIDYTDKVKALEDITVEQDKVGMLAISTDEFTREQRTIGSQEGEVTVDSLLTIKTNMKARPVFTDTQTNNSITATKIYPFAGNPRSCRKGTTVDEHHVSYTICK